MVSSQRCAKGVYELANFLVNWASKNEDYKDAFYPLMMQPVENSNPDIHNSVNFEIYGDSIIEKNNIEEAIIALDNPDELKLFSYINTL
jgi:hypothetical protein